MAASPAERAPFGCRIICDAGLPGPASHDGNGNRFVLIPPGGCGFRHALDVESRAFAPPDAVAQALGPGAMERWGEIEVIDKLLDLPAHLVLRHVLQGNGPRLIRRHQVQMARCDTAALWRVVGQRPV